MKNKLQIGGLSLIAIVLAGAALASSASAAELTFSNRESGAHEHAIVQAAQTTTVSFSVGAGFGAITCTTANLSGTSATGTDAAPELTPEFSGCKDSLGRTTHTKHVKGRWKVGVTYILGVPFFYLEYVGTEHTITVTNGSGVAVCTVTIPSQALGQAGSYESMSSEGGTDLTIKMEANNIKTTTSGGFFNCGVSNGEHTEGTMTGTLTVTAQSTSGAAMNVKTVE
jgi:hypothetical protein